MHSAHTRLLHTGLLLLLSTTLLHTSPVMADTEANLENATQTEINDTLWKPFQQAFEQLDGAALNALYADEVLRVTPAGIDTEGRFKADNLRRFKGNIADGDQIHLAFWFDSRKTHRTTSYAVGFYRMTTVSAAGVSDHFYGQFHIVLRKIQNRWKIVQDWDTTTIAGRPLDAADFARRPPAEF